MYTNRAGRELLKLPWDENPETIEDAHPPRAIDIIINTAIPSAIRDGIWCGETAFLNRDGQEIPVSQVIMAHKSSDGTVEYFSTIVRDISERKKAEDIIAAEKERLSVTLRSIGAALVMDDDEDLRKILDRILKKFGYSTVLTENSREAFSAFIEAEKNEPFATVFLDMTIPGDMGGKEVIKNLLVIRPSLKAVAISGYSEDPVMAEPKKFGFAASLKKPFLKDDVSMVLKKLGI